MNHAALFHTDAREYDVADVVEQALDLYAAAQGADRVAVRCLRPLFRADGTPVVRPERPEQVRAVLAGIYDVHHLRDGARAIAELDGREVDDQRDTLGIDGAVGGWHSYFHAQRVTADVTNRMLPGKAGTVTAAGIGQYTMVPADLDPDATAEPGVGVELAAELATALGRIDARIDPRAMLVQQSGRGAYLLLNIEPQPLTARPVIRACIKTLARLVAVVGAAVSVDESVHDPARIFRIAGTTNHKLDADPTTPAWILRPWTPGVRIPWAAIERLAAPSRPRLRLVAGGRSASSRSASRSPSTRRSLRDLFTVRGWLYAERPDGICDVRCPNAEQHTDGRLAAILYPPSEPGGPGWVKCSHAHCADLTLADVYGALERT